MYSSESNRSAKRFTDRLVRVVMPQSQMVLQALHVFCTGINVSLNSVIPEYRIVEVALCVYSVRHVYRLDMWIVLLLQVV